MSPSSTFGFGQKLRNWLRKFNFDEDPFATYEAENEESDLLNFFVERPYLNEILGDPERPRSGFLLAGRGAGKTATREIVANECAHGSFRRRALPVRYFDFSSLLEAVNGDLSRITARLHVRFLIRAILQALAEDIPPTYFEHLEDQERSLLAGFAEAFGDPLSKLKLRPALNTQPLLLPWEELSPAEMLGAIAQIPTQLGPAELAKTHADHKEEHHYQSLYILVDRVDETPGGSQAAVSILSPLLGDRLLLETPNVAFKFFLPAEVGQQLQEHIDLRPDRLTLCWITWPEVELRKVIEQRLAYYSNNNIYSLEEICCSTARSRTMSRLIDTAGGSPRTLLRLCRALIHYVADRGATLIQPEDVTNTLVEFEHRLRVEQTAALITQPQIDVTHVNSPAPVVPPATGLSVDLEGGHVWVDGSQVTPPLTQQEFALVKLLYVNAPEILSYEELIKNVWSESELVTGDEQNLRKLISRLRKRLEPGTRDGNWRFIHSARGRGYWLNRQ